MLPKKKKIPPPFPKRKNKTIGSGEKKKAAKKRAEKRPFQQTKKNLHLHLRANFLKKPQTNSTALTGTGKCHVAPNGI